MEQQHPHGSPHQTVGQFEMLAGTVKEEGEGQEMVRKVSVGWRVEWSEERYSGEEDSGTTSIDKDEVRGLIVSAIDC